MRIALIAYGCEPGKSSEVGVGWRWASEILARGHEVVVYTHASQRQAIERDAASRIPGLSFVYHQVGNWPLEHSNRAIHQLQYTYWQWSVMSRVAKDGVERAFDLVHFLTWGGVRMPVFGWRTRVPYVIGPVGGGEEAPLQYCWGLGLRIYCKELLRATLNRWCLVDPILRAGYLRASRIYLKTSDSRKLIPAAARKRTKVSLEIGARSELLQKRIRIDRNRGGQPLRLIFVGRLLYWKSPLTVAAVYAEVLRRGVEAELTIIGAGPEQARLLAAIDNLPRSARVRHEPYLPLAQLFDLMQEQDIALFPSLHDSSGNFVLESLSCGLPVVALSLGGPRELLGKGGGVLVSTEGRSPRQVIEAMADAIVRLAESPFELEKLRIDARAAALATAWPAPVTRLYEPLEQTFAQREAGAY
jgi:glycosyltransferase involved in cell wall biosynthesis